MGKNTQYPATSRIGASVIDPEAREKYPATILRTPAPNIIWLRRPKRILGAEFSTLDLLACLLLL
jgi:hypothetical protein